MYERLQLFLQHQMPAAQDLRVSNVMRLVGGASRESFSFEASWREGGRVLEHSWVLRRDPVASVAFTQREREYAVLKLVERTPVPAPKAYWLEMDGSWLERPFMILERFYGSTTNSFGLLCEGNDALRQRLARQYVETLVQLHSTDWRRLDEDQGLEIPEDPAHYPAQAVAHMDLALWFVNQDPQPIMREAVNWLRSNAPTTDELVLTHGDYKGDNIIYNDGGLVGVLDWEAAHVGDRLEDLGWATINFWQVEGLCCGLIEREELISTYEKLSGRKVDRQKLFWWEVFSNLKMAMVCQYGVRSFADNPGISLVPGFLGFLAPRLYEDMYRQLYD